MSEQEDQGKYLTVTKADRTQSISPLLIMQNHRALCNTSLLCTGAYKREFYDDAYGRASQ